MNKILEKNLNKLVLTNAKTGENVLEIDDQGILSVSNDYNLFIDEKEDKIITCRDCGEEFEFTFNEQRFYEEKGFNFPSRCKSCRDKRKQ